MSPIVVLFALLLISTSLAFRLPTKMNAAENTGVSLPKKFYALRYTYVENMEERRAPVRAEHLDLIKEYEEAGSCVMGGAFINPIDGGFLLFETEEAAQEFVSKDPYVSNDLVPSYDIREYMVVSGTAFKN
mmetsp:Transcript_15977/g.20005  ORF Transcript_15977/g.20005 Transcript_15977/m.20005 type:complete len:131 (+) Transcript_15977:54-446(+)